MDPLAISHLGQSTASRLTAPKLAGDNAIQDNQSAAFLMPNDAEPAFHSPWNRLGRGDPCTKNVNWIRSCRESPRWRRKRVRGQCRFPSAHAWQFAARAGTERAKPAITPVMLRCPPWYSITLKLDRLPDRAPRYRAGHRAHTWITQSLDF